MSWPTRERVAEIRAEHVAAIESLTPPQRRALERLSYARDMARHTLATAATRLEAVFELEAAGRWPVQG